MGKVVRTLKFDGRKSAIEELKNIYSVNRENEIIKVEEGVTTYKGVELDSILVNIIEEINNSDTVIKIEKLVSLKAFLLSKEQNMDINLLLYNIDKVMKMSDDGLNKDEHGIIFDNQLKAFLKEANIDAVDSEDNIILSDGKRKTSVAVHNNSINFNTIIELGI
ncbi:hypothetical protein [Clostridium cylindrosporum]|uniref:Uncharacterized protein n=1 Tax=Clostridium cylindrosporum DSM 605 TaxID=1121307 RepID=A0A0J8D484_CLOCY|nr:hypothetical protein [Clostridium cylindrosporum]KMT20990.1 hypothetical protein CLCY_1c02240 [Clostridium cylindrosporum DSM 605]